MGLILDLGYHAPVVTLFLPKGGVWIIEPLFDLLLPSGM